MMKIRNSEDRGHNHLDWLDSRFTFSFADYIDPQHTHFRSLRVINEDWIQASKGFGMHPHRDMEILTYVLEGQLQHQDDMGNHSIIHAGDVQKMSAGTGVMHSEFNPSETDKVHLLQIWIFPDKKNYQPDYEQKHFSTQDKQDTLRLIASADGREGSMLLHQDVSVYASILSPSAQVKFDDCSHRHLWIQLIRGKIILNSTELTAGDGAAMTTPDEIQIKAIEESEFLLFDLP